ncbi:MAG: TonB-dependent receptor plug domain-containing protein, partial [Opitutales bacterium]|nr:TonB-dependent receptor plug domain-containing protein [Opitutales bacterium]
MENLEVEAYNFDYDLLSVPSNNTYISREQILNSAASGVAEILQNKANLLFRSTSGSILNGEVAMRGYGENSASRVLVIVDGRRLNPADLSSANWLQIPLDNIESIEVLRGSHSAQYGNNAVAGVIKINTLKGGEDFVGVRAVFGSYGLYSVNANLSSSYGDFFGSIEGSLLHDGGYRQNSKIFNKSVNAGLGYDFDEKKTLDFSVNFSDQYVEFPGALTWQEAHDNPRKSDLVFEQNGNQNLGLVAASFKNKSGIGEGEILLGANMRDMKWSMSGTWYDNCQYGSSMNLKQGAQ